MTAAEPIGEPMTQFIEFANETLNLVTIGRVRVEGTKVLLTLLDDTILEEDHDPGMAWSSGPEARYAEISALLLARRLAEIS